MNPLIIPLALFIILQTPTPTPTPGPTATGCITATAQPTRTKIFGTPVHTSTPTPPGCLRGQYHTINYFWGDTPPGGVTVSNPTRFLLEYATPYWAIAVDFDGVPLQNAPIAVSLSCQAGIAKSFTTNTDGEGNFSYSSPFVGQICSLASLSLTLPRAGILHVQGVELMEDCQNSGGVLVQATPTPAPQPTPILQWGDYYILTTQMDYHHGWDVGGSNIIAVDAYCRGGDRVAGAKIYFDTNGGQRGVYGYWGTVGYENEVQYNAGGIGELGGVVGFAWHNSQNSPNNLGFYDDDYTVLGVGTVNVFGLRVGGKSNNKYAYWQIYTDQVSILCQLDTWGPTPTPTPTSTPTLTPQPTPPPPTCGNTNPGGGPVIIPTGPQTCTTILPDWHFTVPTVNTIFGNMQGSTIGWDGVQVCTQYWTLNFPTLFGISISQLLVSFAGVSIIVYTQRRMDN